MEVNKLNLVLIGADQAVLDKQNTLLSGLGVLKTNVVCSKVIIDAISQYSHDENMIVIVNLTPNGLHELKFIEKLEDKRSSMIIIGDQGNVELLTEALRAGVKDFIDEKDYQEKLVGVFSKVKKNLTYSNSSKNVKRLNVFINAKGGSGASFIASNVAYVLSKEAQLKVALVDLDLQFGSIGLNFDKVPKYTLSEAVNAIDDLDAISLEAYLLKYNENLNLLLPSPSEIFLPGEVDVSKLKKLIQLLKINFSQTVIDMPHLIDPVLNMIMELADQVVIVLHQNLAQYRDGRRLIQILNKDLDLPLDKIAIVINRFDPKNSLCVNDLKGLLNHDRVYTVTSDFELVEGSTNLGVPLCETSADSQIAKDLRALARNLGHVEFREKKKGFLSFLGLNR